MLLSEICKYACIDGFSRLSRDVEITDVTSFSSSVRKGSLFFALEGLKNDGHEYLYEAERKGAFAVVVKSGRKKDFPLLSLPVLEAENTRKSLSLALDAICNYPSEKLKIIALTGTNGKTTISYMLSHILGKAGYKCGIIGTLGATLGNEKTELQSVNPLANMTTPDPEELYPTLEYFFNNKVDFVIMEASSHASVLEKLAPLKFKYAIFSNLSPEHLDFHKNMDDYLDAKIKILRQAEKIIINADSPYSERIVNEIKDREIISVSKKTQKSDFFCENISSSPLSFDISDMSENKKREKITLNTEGEFNIENASLAFSCVRSLGVSGAVCADALATFAGTPGRMQKIILNEKIKFSVFIDYAHTPDALENVLVSLRKKLKGRLILLFGCGGERDRKKRPLMGNVAAKNADFLIVTSDNPRGEEREEIIKEILIGIPKNYKNIFVNPNRKEAIEYALSIAKAGDIVLLTGKGHEKYEIDEKGRHPFDEEEIVSAYADKYINKNNGAE